MKKTFKLTLLGGLLAAAGFASAQSVDYRLENSGRIYNRIETNASAVNGGTSNSVAKGEMSSSAQGGVSSNPIAGGQSLALWGTVETKGSGMAFNHSTPGGNGYAKVEGWADANVNGYNNFTNQHGTLQMNGFTDSGMASPVGHGVDVKIDAGRSQDGYAAGADGGSFAINGQTQQNPIAGGATVSAWVSDVKTSHSSAEAGGVTFTGGTPAGQAAATVRTANSGNVTEARGYFYDPAGF